MESSRLARRSPPPRLLVVLCKVELKVLRAGRVYKGRFCLPFITSGLSCD